MGNRTNKNIHETQWEKSYKEAIEEKDTQYKIKIYETKIY